MVRSRRVLIALVVSLVAVLLAAGFGLASADPGESPETIMTALQPGDNYVGWVAENSANRITLRGSAADRADLYVGHRRAAVPHGGSRCASGGVDVVGP